MASPATIEPLFAEFSRTLVDASGNVIYLIDSELRIAYCNPAWETFAKANEGEKALAAQVTGTPLFDYIAAPLRDFYERVFGDARSDPLPISFNFECSSPEVRRLMRMEVRYLANSRGWAVTTSLRQEQEHSDEAHPANPQLYLAATGLIGMCCHCRKTRRAHEPDVWDWVPQYVRHMPRNTTHGICPSCIAYFYPNTRAAALRSAAGETR